MKLCAMQPGRREQAEIICVTKYECAAFSVLVNESGPQMLFSF